MPLGIELRYRGVHPKAIRGLFHGKQIQHGFQCVDKGKRPRTRRDWKPNVQYKHLFSEALQCQVKVCVTTHALKRIDRAGGLDMYLLTTPAASRGSIVADELRKSIVKEYMTSKQGLPQKQGHTSIISLVDQRLRDAGLRAQRPPSHHQGSLDAASGPPSAASSSTQTSTARASGAVKQALNGLHAEGPRDAWAPYVSVPHQDEPYRMRSQRKTAIIKHILERKGFSEAVSAGSVVNRSELAHARRLAARNLKTQNRHQLLSKLPKASRKRLERALQIKKQTCLLHRRLSTDLSSGKRVSQQILEAMRRAKIDWRRKITRRNNLVATKRGQAHNEMLKRIASSPEAAMFLRFAWLQTFVGEMPAGLGKEAWRALAEKYQPTTPGMLIDGVFVPATNKYAVGSKRDVAVKSHELPPMFPPALDPAATLSPDSVTDNATAEDVLRAANAVAFLPDDSELRPATVEKMAEQGARWRDLELQQQHADKLYQLMRDMKQRHPQQADAIERSVKQELQPLGLVIDSQAGITDAYAKHGGLNGTLRTLLHAAALRSSSSVNRTKTSGNLSARAAKGSTFERKSASGSAAGDDDKVDSAEVDGARKTSVSRQYSASGSADRSKIAEEGTKSDAAGTPQRVRRLVRTRMAYSERRKLKKMRKWLDDDWLKKYVVYGNAPHRLVLGNGMVLAMRSHKQPMPDSLSEELQAAYDRIQEEIDELRVQASEQRQSATSSSLNRLKASGRFATLPGVPGSYIPG